MDGFGPHELETFISTLGAPMRSSRFVGREFGPTRSAESSHGDHCRHERNANASSTAALRVLHAARARRRIIAPRPRLQAGTKCRRRPFAKPRTDCDEGPSRIKGGGDLEADIEQQHPSNERTRCRIDRAQFPRMGFTARHAKCAARYRAELPPRIAQK